MRVDTFVRQFGLEALVERCKIRTRRHGIYPNLVTLSYSLRESLLDDPLTLQCRGIILDESDDWKIISYPYDKFFNLGESRAASIDWSTAKVFPKLDGVLVTLYSYRGHWLVSTSGSPDATGHKTRGLRYCDLFWEIWEKEGYELPSDTSKCYMFEMTSPRCPIIVRQTEDKLTAHGARCLKTYKEVPVQELWRLIEPLEDFASLEGVRAGAACLEGLVDEGFVVCDQLYRRVKIKAPDYVRLHHYVAQLNSPLVQLQTVLKGEVAEVLAYFPEIEGDLCHMERLLSDLRSEVEARFDEVKAIESPKEFAAAVSPFTYKVLLFNLRQGYSFDSAIHRMRPRYLLHLLTSKES